MRSNDGSYGACNRQIRRSFRTVDQTRFVLGCAMAEKRGPMKIKTNIKQLITTLLNSMKERKKWVLALSCLVVFCTTYLLILPAFTLDKEEASEQGGVDVPGVEQSVDADETTEDLAKVISEDNEKEESAEASSEDVEKEEVTKPAAEKPAKASKKETSKSDAKKKSADITLENDESDDFSVAVESKDAVLSEDMSVAVREIDKSDKKQKKEYDSLYNDALEAVQKAQEDEGQEKPSDFAFAKFYDISLMDGDTEVEPDAAVDVKISFSEDLQKELKVADPERVHIVHFAVDKESGEVTPEVLDADTTDITVKNNKVTEAAFTADSFSVFAVVYSTIEKTFISASGDTYEVTVKYDESAEIPEDAELVVREIAAGSKEYKKNVLAANKTVSESKGEFVDPAQFDISIVSDGEEIEPKEGSTVSVEIRLAKSLFEKNDNKKSDKNEEKEVGTLFINGEEVTSGTNEIRSFIVAHIADNGTAEIIEEVNTTATDSELVMDFDTDSFSDYTIQPGNGGVDWNSLPSTIYVGDEIYMQNLADYWVTGIDSVVSETKYDGDGYKSVRATSPGTFRICHRNDWNNGNTGYTNQYPGKYITILPARSEGGYEGTTPPGTIDTIDNASIGLTLNLFDYDLDDYLDNRFNNKDYGDHLRNFKDHGINNGNALKFWGSGITDSSYGSHNNYDPHGVSNIVANTLNASGYPQVTSGAGGSGGGGTRDLSYLFTPSNGNDDKNSYMNVNHLFKKDGDYYVYDSNENYAYYDKQQGNGGSFTVYNSTYEQKSRDPKDGSYGGEQAYSTNGKAIGFFPFHEWDEKYDLFVNWNKNMNHHFGMSMSVDFSLPKEPKAVEDTDGNPIVFEFSGDDDLWVFIDGKLAMDIGGIHLPTSGVIDFKAREVRVQNGDKETDTKVQMTTAQFNQRFPDLYDGKKHTMQVFYIERGGCDSNCKIKFNMTQYGDIHFDKVDKENPTDKLAGAVFGIYKDEKCTKPLMENLNDGTSRVYIAESNAQGRVQFSDIPLGRYYLKELHAPEGYPLDDSVHIVDVFIDQSTGQVKVEVTIDGTAVSRGVKITNEKPKPIDLGLKKEWQDKDETEITAPDGVTATFEIKRIRSYEIVTEEEIEGEKPNTSHLVVGWLNNNRPYEYEEFDFVAGSRVTVSWGYVNGYQGRFGSVLNGQEDIKSANPNNIYSKGFVMPAAGQTAILYIIDDSEDGSAISGINVAGSEFYGNSGGGYIHKIYKKTEIDPDFTYSGNNVTDNKVTLPINGSTWEYLFSNLPTFGNGTVRTAVEEDGEEQEYNVAFRYSYYLEEVSNTAPDGTTVIYKDSHENELQTPADAETSVTGTETIINRVPFGYLKIKKEVTYNESNQNLTAAQKSKLAGEYKFKIYTKQQCADADAVQDPNAPDEAEDKDLIITITIGNDGQAVSSDAIKLIAGKYWIKEVESSNPAMFPVENPIQVNVTKGDTITEPVIVSLTNNYDENNGPDKISLDIEKKFSGLDASAVPAEFQVKLHYTVNNQPREVTLSNTELATGENGEKIVWSQSTDGLTWHWKVTNIPSEAKDFEVKEENYDKAKGYDWKSATLNGTDITSTVTSWHDLTVTAPAANLRDVTNDRRTSDSGQNTVFYLEDDDILLTKLTANLGTLVISKHPLNLAERDAVVKGWPEQGGFKTPPHYFSIEEHPNGFTYDKKTVTFGEKDGRTIVKFAQSASAQETVFAVTYDSEESRNNANLENTYENVPVTIDIIKVDEKDTAKKLPGAVFKLRQIADKAPTPDGTLETLDGTTPIDSDPTDANGKTSFSDLTKGYYEISEKTAPDGYVLPDDVIFYLKVEAGTVTYLEKGTGKPSTWTSASSGGKIVFTAAQEEENASFRVSNTPGTELPHTGGVGTTIFYILGIILTMVSGMLFWKKRRTN